MGENRPSDVFFALWFYRSRGGPSITQEDFKVCAEAWRELRNREAEEERKAAEARRFRELLNGLPEYPGPGRVDSAGGAGGPGDPSAAPRDDKEEAPRDDGAAGGAEDPGDPSAAPRDDSKKAPRDDRENAPRDDMVEDPGDPSAAPRDDSKKAPTLLSGPWSSFKNEILARLEKARKEDGLTLAQVVAASDGKLTDLQLLDMLNRSRMPMAKWDELSGTLAALGYPAPDNSPPPHGRRS